MISGKLLFGSLPVLLALGVGCSADVADGGDTPLGQASGAGSGGAAISGAGGTGSAGIGSAGISSAGIGSGGIGSAGTSSGGANAGAATVGGTFNNNGGAFTGTGGGSAGGVPGQAGSTGQAGAGGSGVTPTDGKGLYDANCKQCHGEQGVGTLLAPETQHPVRDYSKWVVRNGRAQTTFPKPMEKYGTDKLTDAQLTLIWDYLDLPPQPTTGKLLYNDYCANCHGADGKGGPTTRNIVNEVQNVLKMVRSGKSVGNYAMRHDSMPAFTTMRISDAELTLIHDYVDSF